MNKNINNSNLKFINNLIKFNKKIKLILKSKYMNLKLFIGLNSFILPNIDNDINIPTDSHNISNNLVNDIGNLFTNVFDGLDSFIGDIGNDFSSFDGFDNPDGGGDNGGCLF